MNLYRENFTVRFSLIYTFVVLTLTCAKNILG